MMHDQISQKARQREMGWFKRQLEEAAVNVAAPIENYQAATWFDLNARKDWDGAAKLEIERRRNN